MANFADTTTEDETIKADIAEIDELNALTEGSRLSFKEFFTNGREMNLWRAAAACGSQACQQIGGINLVTFVAHKIESTNYWC